MPATIRFGAVRVCVLAAVLSLSVMPDASLAGIAAAGDEYWSAAFAPVGVSRPDDTAGMVYGLASFGNHLYVGGDFATAGGLSSPHVARWDAEGGWLAFDAQGSYVSSTSVKAIVEFGGQTIVAGKFDWGSGRRNIARWDGAAWQPLWAGLDGVVEALAVYGGQLYAAGHFRNADAVPVEFIARWDGAAWSDVAGGLHGPALALAVYGGELVVTGAFPMAGDVPVARIAAWNGTSWHGFGSGMAFGSGGAALLAVGADLYVAGNFFEAGGVSVRNIARWDGAAWSNLGLGVSGEIKALAVYGGAVVAGGTFFEAGGADVNNAARWNGSRWTALGAGVAGRIDRLVVHDGYLVAGGDCAVAGNRRVNGLARWDGADWQPVDAGRGLDNNYVRALAVHDDVLYAGGTFRSGGGAPYPLNAVAAWTGDGWDDLGSGLNGACNAMCSYGSRLVAGGSFTSAGGVPAARIAAWDGAAWSPLGPGVNGEVKALTVFAGDLIAGGAFTVAGAVSSVNHIARWDGSNWHALGTGLEFADAEVLALAEFAGSLYAGGLFTRAGGEVVQDIARWDGTTWHALPGTGAGTNHAVTALCVHQGRLVAGGLFATIGGVAAGGVAAWDGSSWSGLGFDAVSPYPAVEAVASVGNALVAAGYPTPAVWVHDGAGWSALGSGAAGARAVQGYHDAVFVGLDGRTAGGKPSSWIGRWDGLTAGCAVVVTAPADGAALCEGAPATITWSRLGSCAGTVRVSLLRDGAECSVLAEAAPNTGAFLWTPQRCGGQAGGYAVRVAEVGGAAVGTSPGNFTIAGGAVVAMTYPDGGEVLGAGSTIDVTWTTGACSGPSVRLELLRAGAPCAVIAASTPNDGSHAWYVAPCGEAADGYAVRVTDLSSSATDTSHGTFRIASSFRLSSIVDVGGDQGRQVRVRWDRHPNDAANAEPAITSYSLWRRIDGGRQAAPTRADAASPAGLVAARTYPPGAWDFVTWLPAGGESTYSAVVPTLCDSTVGGGVCWSVFFARAHTATPTVFFDAPPDSGWSVDNLAPAAPVGLACAGDGTLSWEPAPEPDLGYYSVYGSTTDRLDGSVALLGRTTATSQASLPPGHAYYLVTATDTGGNESAAAAAPAVECGPGSVPTVFNLLPCVPNPFNPGTTLRFDVPRPARVTVRVFDAAGRLVATLLDHVAEAAGRREVNWRGLDASGRAVAAGTYFCRLEADGFTQTRGMTLLR